MFNRKYPSKDLAYVLKNYPYTKGLALDIGCGFGADSLHLIASGFKVVGVDAKDSIMEELKKLPNFNFYNEKIETYDFDKYDFINAQFVFPFVKKDRFEDIVFKCKKSLNSGGYFIGQFLGVDDEWKTIGKNYNFVTKSKALKLLFGMDLLKFSDTRFHGFTYNKKPKFWHYFEFIVRKQS